MDYLPVYADEASVEQHVTGFATVRIDPDRQQLIGLTNGLNGAFSRIERNSQGVALAIAMGGGFLSDDKKFSLWGAWGNFDGYNGLAAQTYIRLSDDVILNGGISFGLEEELVGTRVGIGIQF